MEFWIKAAQLILSLSILIVLHEFGHFIPARLFKIRVEKFYLFFDPWFSLVKKKIKGTEWGIGWLPLGGYVKIAGMVDESMDKEQMALPPKPDEFRSKPAWQRLIVMIGGVVVNVIVGFTIYIIILAVWGEDKINQSKLKDGIAVHPYMEQYGFRSGDQILTMDGKKVDQLDKLSAEIMIFNKRNFTVRHQDNSIQAIQLPKDIGKKMFANGSELAFTFRRTLGKIDSILPEGNAKSALQKGDSVLTINGEHITYFDEFSSQLYANKSKTVDFKIYRGKEIIVKKVNVDSGGAIGIQIGSYLPKSVKAAIYHVDYGFFPSIGMGIKKGAKTLYMNVAQFKYVFTKKGASSIGGFASIGKLFSPEWDWQSFWTLTAFISFALAFMNILPIPALDGGHVIFLLYEIITRRAPSQKVLETAQYIGFFLLIGLLLYANGNDLIKAIFK